MAAKADNITGGETLERVLSSLDALHTRMDAMELGEGSKNPLKKDAAKGDASKADEDKEEEEKEDSRKDGGRKDEDKEEEEKKEDSSKSDGGKKDQAPPPAGGTGATPPPAAGPMLADKKKDARDDGGRKDQVEDDSRKDARADEVGELRGQVASLTDIIKRMQETMKPRTDEEHHAFADAQARADAVFQGFGEYAPRPMEGETLLRYRKRLATALKKHSGDWKDVKFSELPDSAFSIVESKVYADAVAAAANPIDLQPGELRELKSVTQAGHAMTTFLGKDSFVKGLNQENRRAKINNFPARGAPAY